MLTSEMTTQWWWLFPSPANHHELLELELPWAWEPMASSRAFQSGEGKSSHDSLSNGDKEEESLFGEDLMLSGF